MQRKVLTPNDFTDLAEVASGCSAFQRRYEQTAVPFDWRSPRADLNKLLDASPSTSPSSKRRDTTHELPYGGA